MIFTHERLKKKENLQVKIGGSIHRKDTRNHKTRRCKTSINRKNSTAFRAKES